MEVQVATINKSLPHDAGAKLHGDGGRAATSMNIHDTGTNAAHRFWP